MSTTHDLVEPGGAGRGAPPSFGAFVVGVLLMTVFVAAGGGGAWWGVERILLHRALEREGATVEGRVLRVEKTTSRTTGSAGSSSFDVSYRYPVEDRELEASARIPSELAHRLHADEPIEIRYLPEEPDRSLPVRAPLDNVFWLAAAFGTVIAGGAVIVLVGMVVTQLRHRSPV